MSLYSFKIGFTKKKTVLKCIMIMILFYHLDQNMDVII
jgi:hypothetical protein